MLYKIFNFIKLLLPFWLVMFIYKGQRGLPANIKLRSGRNLRAVMVTTEYGVLYTAEKYNAERLARLREEMLATAERYDNISKEINSLRFDAREELFEEVEHGDYKAVRKKQD